MQAWLVGVGVGMGPGNRKRQDLGLNQCYLPSTMLF